VSLAFALCAIIGVLLLALTTTLYVAQSDMTAILLVPLLIWLCFATYLSLQDSCGVALGTHNSDIRQSHALEL
jgi:tryptophan-rich sensory protein